MSKTAVIVFLLAAIIGYNLYDGFDPGVVKGKRVLVTGASTGIGEQMAYHYARMGASVLITARREQRLKEVIEKCKEIGSSEASYHYISADMGKSEDREKVIDAAKTSLGGLDYLVLNHIIDSGLWAWRGGPENMNMLDRTFEINFKAYVHLSSLSFDMLEESKGSIVVVSSIAGKIGGPYVTAYAASKYALDGFFTSLRQEFIMRENGVSITLCIIGRIQTENAVRNLRTLGAHKIVDILPMASAEDAGWAIIRGGAMRARDVYFPKAEAFPTISIRDWLPGVNEYISRYLFQLS